MIWVCYADTSPLNDDGLYQAIYKNTSSVRREKADRLRSALGAYEFTADEVDGLIEKAP